MAIFSFMAFIENYDFYSSSTHISFAKTAFPVLNNKKTTTRDKRINNTPETYLKKIRPVSWNINTLAMVIAERGKEYAHQDK